MCMKYLISKPVSPNNSNRMFISSLLLQSSQFPSCLWCVWKWDIEKLREEKVTASSQQWKKEKETSHYKQQILKRVPASQIAPAKHVSSKEKQKISSLSHWRYSQLALRSRAFFILCRDNQVQDLLPLSYLGTMPVSSNYCGSLITTLLVLKLPKKFPSL